MTSRRMIDPAFWQSEGLARYNFFQRLLFAGLFSNADDQGRIRAHPAFLRSKIFPYDDVSLDDIENSLEIFVNDERICVYSVDGSTYLQIINWWTWQPLHWARPSKLPAPEGWVDRIRYRQGNEVVSQSWDTEPVIEESLSDEDEPNSEPTVSPSRPHGEPTLEPAPRLDETSLDQTRLDKSKDSAEKPAHPPPKRHPPPRKPKTKAKTPLAVLTFRDNAHRYPAKSWYQDVDDAVGEQPDDLEFWGQVVKDWVGRGYNPINVKGMLDCYQQRQLPGNSKPGEQGTAVKGV